MAEKGSEDDLPGSPQHKPTPALAQQDSRWQTIAT